MSSEEEILRETELIAADAIGDVIEFWGFRKALGRVWAVLYLSHESLPSTVLAERLQMSAGAMSMALSELQRWGVVRRVWRPGERREFFEAETDFWKMISKVVSERERFLAVSVRERLENSVAILEKLQSEPGKNAYERAKRLLSLARVAEQVIEGFLASRRADFSEFGEVLQLMRPLSKSLRS